MSAKRCMFRADRHTSSAHHPAGVVCVLGAWSSTAAHTCGLGATASAAIAVVVVLAVVELRRLAAVCVTPPDAAPVRAAAAVDVAAHHSNCLLLLGSAEACGDNALALVLLAPGATITCYCYNTGSARLSAC